MEIIKNDARKKVVIEDLDDVQHTLTANRITLDTLDEIESLKNKKNITNKEIILKCLYIYFGKNEDFWNNFSIDVLMQLANYMGGAYTPESVKKKTG